MSLWFKKVLWNIFFTEILTSHSLLTNKSSSHGIEKTVVARRKKRERFSLVLVLLMEGKQFGAKMDSRKYNLPPELPRVASEVARNRFYPSLLSRLPSSALDLKHDKQERIVKLSRDITAESKKIIFLLHRITWWATEHFYSGWPNMRADIRLVWPIFLALNCWTY